MEVECLLVKIQNFIVETIQTIMNSMICDIFEVLQPNFSPNNSMIYESHLLPEDLLEACFQTLNHFKKTEDGQDHF